MKALIILLIMIGIGVIFIVIPEFVIPPDFRKFFEKIGYAILFTIIGYFGKRLFQLIKIRINKSKVD
jgi:hypothetical protein